jgi:hypothetical protein
MKTVVSAPLLVALLALPSALEAKSDCPPREEGVLPWVTGDSWPDDRWAWVYLEIDTRGRPLACRIGENNMSPALRSKACRSFVHNWTAVPVMRDGKAVRTIIKRRFVVMSDKHFEANSEARKRFFLEHPEERPECYRG